MKLILIVFISLISLKVFAQREYILSSSDQTQLHVREFGVDEPIILLSGGPGLNADYLKPIWDTLSKTYRCVILDQRGTGKSVISVVDSASMSMEKYVYDIEALQLYLELDKVTLVGHSWGGMLAMEYASRYPEKVQRLVLIGPGGPTALFTSYFKDNMTMRLYKEDLEEAKMLSDQEESTLEAVWPGYFFDREKGLISKNNIDFKSISGQKGVNNITAYNYFSSGDERVLLLKKYKGEVHIIQGRQDPIGESTVYEIKEVMLQSEFHFIEGCGHFPWLENEKQVTEFYSLLRESLK